MLARLVQFSLSQRLFVLLAACCLPAPAGMPMKGLPIDAFPDVSSTQVKIIMKAPGMTPEEVESRIAVPLEVEMLGIPEPVILRSMAKYGLVDVTIDFEDGTDIYWARQQVSERLADVTDNLPAGSQRRHGADHDPARRDVHVHRRSGRHVAGGAAQCCSTG